MKYVLPVGIVIIFVLGYAPIVSTWLGVFVAIYLSASRVLCARF